MGETSKTNSDLLNASDKWFNNYQSVETMASGVFKGVSDRFNGVTIDSGSETCDNAEFDGILSKSLEHWTQEKRRAIWFKVHRNQAGWLPALAKNDFLFHHARDEVVMMYKWLPTTEPSAIPPYSISSTSRLHDIFKVQDEKDFDARVLKSKTPIVVDFFATWCGPCKMLTPRIETIINESKGKVSLAKVDIDELTELALEYEVQSVPVLAVVKDGKVVKKLVGLHDTDKLRKWVTESI